MPRPSRSSIRARFKPPSPPSRFYYLHEKRIWAIDEALAILDAKEAENPHDRRIAPERARFTLERRRLAGEAWFQEWWNAVGAAAMIADQTRQRDALDARLNKDMTQAEIDAARKRLGL